MLQEIANDPYAAISIYFIVTLLFTLVLYISNHVKNNQQNGVDYNYKMLIALLICIVVLFIAQFYMIVAMLLHFKAICIISLIIGFVFIKSSVKKMPNVDA